MGLLDMIGRLIGCDRPPDSVAEESEQPSLAYVDEHGRQRYWRGTDATARALGIADAMRNISVGRGTQDEAPPVPVSPSDRLGRPDALADFQHMVIAAEELAVEIAGIARVLANANSTAAPPPQSARDRNTEHDARNVEAPSLMSDEDALAVAGLTFGPVGSEAGTLVATFQRNGQVMVRRGCFHGTLAEFREAVTEKHGHAEPRDPVLHDRHFRDYQLLIEMIDRLASRLATRTL